jgi:hypothetical protein
MPLPSPKPRIDAKGAAATLIKAGQERAAHAGLGFAALFAEVERAREALIDAALEFCSKTSSKEAGAMLALLAAGMLRGKRGRPRKIALTQDELRLVEAYHIMIRMEPTEHKKWLKKLANHLPGHSEGAKIKHMHRIIDQCSTAC